MSSPNTIEPFSSQGPNEAGVTKARRRRRLNRVSGSSYGATGFAGTSAASPHTAGAAALVLQANPSYTPAQVKAFLEGRAIGLGAAGKDNVYGSGRLALGTAPVIGTPTPTNTPTITPTPTNTPTRTPTFYIRQRRARRPSRRPILPRSRPPARRIQTLSRSSRRIRALAMQRRRNVRSRSMPAPIRIGCCLSASAWRTRRAASRA